MNESIGIVLLSSSCTSYGLNSILPPFKYRGETYNTCTYDYSEGKPWCQTNDTNEDGNFEEGWGVCDEKCPHDHYSGKERGFYWIMLINQNVLYIHISAKVLSYIHVFI